MEGPSLGTGEEVVAMSALVQCRDEKPRRSCATAMSRCAMLGKRVRVTVLADGGLVRDGDWTDLTVV